MQTRKTIGYPVAVVLGIVIFSVVTNGCGGEDEVGSEEVQSALGSYVAGPFSWDQSFLGPEQLKPSSSHVCVLAGGAGAFRGEGEVIWVYTDTDGFWYAGGRSGQQGVSAKSYCFDLSHFTGPMPAGDTQPARWLSREFFSWERVSGCRVILPFFQTICILDDKPPEDMYLGDAASFLTGMSGEFNLPPGGHRAA